MAKKRKTKIAIVGGGSYSWMPRILSDVTYSDILDNSEIALLDINVKAAEEVASAGIKMAADQKRNLKFTATSNPKNAFSGADFVLITISTGGLDMMEHDLKIPEKYKIYQTVGDTVGPGGWSRSLRNIPVFIKLANQIEKYAPNAAVLNYTNPMASLTDIFYRVSNLQTVGLCHGVFSNYSIIQKIFNCKENDISMNFGGANHFFFIFDFMVKGKKGYPALAGKLKGKTLDKLIKDGERDAVGFHSNHAFCDEIYRQYGYLTFCADRHTSEFVPGILNGSKDNIKKFKLVRTTVANRRKRLKNNRKRTLDLAAGKFEQYPRTRETAVDIMEAITTGKPFVDVVNLPNTGQIDNLPRGAVVETLGMVDQLGFRAVNAGSMPETIKCLVEPHCNVQLLTVKAAMEGNKKLALEALTLDPMCSHLGPSKVKEMGMKLLSATGKYLPQFK
ncbi:MAG: family 4 glycosyl hydrolase [Planctomycetota bacterium]|jgi:alpha-galactosidase